jgi:hypothetical protein
MVIVVLGRGIDISHTGSSIAVAAVHASATILGKSTGRSRLSDAISQPRRKSTICLRIHTAASSELPLVTAFAIFSWAFSMRPLAGGSSGHSLSNAEFSSTPTGSRDSNSALLLAPSATRPWYSVSNSVHRLALSRTWRVRCKLTSRAATRASLRLSAHSEAQAGSRTSAAQDHASQFTRNDLIGRWNVQLFKLQAHAVVPGRR